MPILLDRSLKISTGMALPLALLAIGDLGALAGRRLDALSGGERRRVEICRALATRQAIQWPLVELATQSEMLRLLIWKTAWEMDQMPKPEVETW